MPDKNTKLNKEKDEIVEQDTQKRDDCCDVGSDPAPNSLANILEREAQLRAKSGLINTMIYRIRTLSNAVIGFSDLLLTESLQADLADYVKEIHEAGHGLSALVNEVLDWTQLLSGNLQILKTRFRISDLLSEIQLLLSQAARRKGLEYEIVTDPDMPAYLFTDKERLLKCLVNIVSGAIKHTQEGAIRICVRAESGSHESIVCFEITDTGCGIEPEKLARIFEPGIYRIDIDDEILSQLDNGLTVTTGLPLTRQLCELLGGTIQAQSRVGEGSTFSMRIPTAVDSDSQTKLGVINWGPEALSEPDVQEEPERAPKTILLVEDQQSNRTVVTLMLEAIGVQVDAVEGGREALEMVKDSVYDLILMDLKMPEMDGYEATRRLRDAGVSIPIIALSAKVMDESEHYQISEMFDGFLAKPVDSSKLSEMCEKFIPAAGHLNQTDPPVAGEVLFFKFGH